VTTALRRLARAPSRVVRSAYVPARTRSWPAHSRLFVVGDDSGWSIDDDARRLRATARRLGYELAPPAWAGFSRGQAVFIHDHFGALRPRWVDSSHRLGISYFHGRPGTPSHPEFDAAFERLRRYAGRVDRVQVTHTEMHELVASAGISEARIFRIPIGVELERFPLVDPAARASARTKVRLPGTGFVVGSFQKDGVGWGEGLEPKLIKGPDVLVAALERVHRAIPELVVLLTGPARGYVCREFERRGIPYEHLALSSRDELALVYHALDVYLVTSRQEGGPKAMFETTAAGVPLVTTRVGQAEELLADGEDALLADVEDVDALAAAVQRVYDDAALGERLRTNGRAKAEMFSEQRLDVRWDELLDGFVERRSA
jgi:glycosyltransferase involved in cell wall biosynthesis